MQKIRTILLYNMIMAAAAAFFFAFTLRAGAREAAFTHTHGTACYTVRDVPCTGHSVTHSSGTETFHCKQCGAQRPQKVELDRYYCPMLRQSWEMNGYTQCTVCGTVTSRWSGDIGSHSYQERKQVCGIEEGEATATLSVSADSGWTNSGVTLHASLNMLKQDLTLKDVMLSWEDGNLYVTENGVYSVTASDGSGRSISASAEVSCIDKNAPVIESVEGDTGSMSRTGISVSVSARDEESGLHETAYSFDEGQSWGAAAVCYLEEGKEVQLVVRDKAGNTASRTLKRGDYPYPPEPSPSPTPSEQPQPSVPSVSAPADKAGSGTAAPSGPAGGTGQAGSPTGSFGTGTESGDERKNTEPDEGEQQRRSESASRQDTGKNGKSGEAKTETKTDAENQRKDGGKEEDAARESNTAQKKEEIRPEARTAQTAANGGAGAAGAAGIAGTAGAGRTAGTGDARDAASGAKKQEGGETLKNTASETEKALSENTAGNALSDTRRSAARLRSLAGGGLFLLGLGMLCRISWLYSAALYCYNGGEEYRRIGFLRLRKKKQELELYLPEELLEARGMPRYRLMLKRGLVKKHEGKDLVVRGEDYKLRQPLEECVDFVL